MFVLVTISVLTVISSSDALFKSDHRATPFKFPLIPFQRAGVSSHNQEVERRHFQPPQNRQLNVLPRNVAVPRQDEFQLSHAPVAIGIGMDPAGMELEHPQPPVAAQARYPVRMLAPDSYHQERHNMTSIVNYDQQQSASNGWGWSAPAAHHTHHHHSGGGWGWGGGGNKGYDFRPYFDIALTALAFLSLGTFLLNMLLNALLFTGLVTSTGTGTGGVITVTTPTTTGGTSTATGNTNTGGITVTGGGITTTGLFKKELEVGDEEKGRMAEDCFNVSTIADAESRHRVKGRRRRDTLQLFLDPATSMDSMALSVLEAVDAMMYKKECLGKVFCEGNRRAKVAGSGFEFLTPLYSLSASYIGKKFGWHDDMMDHMKGVALGVGESNCQTNFPQC